MSVPSLPISARSSGSLARARVRLVAVIQLPFLGTVSAFAAVIVAGQPAAISDPRYLIALALAIVASVGALTIPWERSHKPLVSIVPTLDIVVIALLRDAVHPHFAIIGVVLIFPAVWLAYVLGTRGMIVGILGSVVVTVLPYLQSQPMPGEVDEWVDLLVTPLIVSFVAVVVRFSVDTKPDATSTWVTVPDQLAASRNAVAETEVILQTVADTVEAAIIMYDGSGAVVLSNARAKDLYIKAGMVPVAGQMPRPRVYRADGVTLVPFGQDVIARTLGGIPLDGQVYWIGDGADRTAVMAMSRKMDSPIGGNLGTVIIAHDVTQLMDSIEIRDQFLSSVSHELKTPLTSILGYVDLIDAEHLGISAEMGVIDKNARRLLALVSDLLSAGGATIVVQRSATRVSTVVEQAVAATRPAAETRNLTMNYAGNDVTADVDTVALRQIVTNLLSNAVKFTEAGGSVTVRLTDDGFDAVLSVTDTGTGIDPVDQRQIFERFYRARSARAAAVPGVGLGLAIAKDLVDAHGGSISVESVVGEGSVLTVRLPLRARATA